MARLSVVLDTNVIVSAHLNADGHERFVLDLPLASKLGMCISREVFREYGDVLRRKKFGIDPVKLDASLQLIRSRARKVRPRSRVTSAADPGDNKFLECAEECGAHYLVTGNKRHFPRQWGVTEVVNARELIEIVTPDLKR